MKLTRHISELPPTTIGGVPFHWGCKTYIMGVLNVTPDSFSGDGLADDIDAAVVRARQLVDQGADIIDVGGESTRPGAPEVGEDEEIHRVVPVIGRLKAELNIPVSVDTYKHRVAEEAALAGADMINDVWGLKRDVGVARIAAEYNLPLIVTASQRDRRVKNIIPAVLRHLRWAIVKAEGFGVSPDNIIVDPGFGFGKSVEQNLEVVRQLFRLKVLGKPILLGASLKSTIGRVLGDVPPSQRLEGTLAAHVVGIVGGADIIRVHDVEAHARAARVTDAIMRGWVDD
ncbi:dihydropteroate synthase [Dehalogenimonas lykanthroporepellens BL-DC-9]|jgi:dihydropteroate synthase|nr:dihydropteroate synthase [Dehalogenimonas lykanthroporepellens BL-DC-9]